VQHGLRAFNTATASANKIHDDAVARRLGFRGGLVPGVDVYAYLCHLPAAHWGQEWLARGTISARFDAPVYDGDDVVVTATPVDDAALDLVLDTTARCARATAALPAAYPAPVDPARWPAGDPPSDPPPASAAALSAAPLGRLLATFHADRAVEYLDDIREDLPLFRVEGLAHPGWLLRFANYVLSTSVRLGPWIHVESTTQLLDVVRDGDELETRALVTDVRERKGHHFVDLDVLQLVGEHPVARHAHTAIYQPRGV
jgi:acyl dehydratase